MGRGAPLSRCVLESYDAVIVGEIFENFHKERKRLL